MISNELNHRLKEIHRDRSKKNFIPVMMVFGISVYFQREKLLQTNLWLVCLGLQIVGAAIRNLSVGTKFEDFVRNRPLIVWANLIGFAMSSLGLGLHFFDVIRHYGGQSQNMALSLLITTAMIAGAGNTLQASKASFITYVSTMELAIIFSLFWHWDSSPHYFILLILLNFFYALYHGKIGHQQLIDQINAQNRLENIIDIVPGFVILLDRNKKVYMANKTALEVYPKLLDVELGQNDPDSQWEKMLIDFMNSDKPSMVQEVQSLAHGEESWSLWHIKRTEDRCAVINAVIITELAKARKLVKAQEAQVQYSSKLASLGEMASGIAHEINNLLAVLQGSMMLVIRSLESNKRDDDHLKNLANKSLDMIKRISGIVKSLRTLSRNGQNDPMVGLDLNALVAQVLDLTEHRCKLESIELILPDLTKEKVMIKGREVELGQVLLNLLNNAMDAVQSSTEKWVKVEYAIGPQVIDLCVIDSGPGVPQEIRKKIMEPFFTTKDIKKGTGLGLSISSTIMENHGGELILLEDRPNTTFCMRFKLN